MKINLEPITDNARYMWQNPTRTATKALQYAIAGGLGYLAYQAGKSAWQSRHAVSCSCTGDLFGITEQLVTVAALCLSSVLISRYNRNAAKPLPNIPDQVRVK